MSSSLILLPFMLMAGASQSPALEPASETTAQVRVAENDKYRLLVLEPTADAEQKRTAQTIGSLIAVELSNYPYFDVVTSADVKQMMELEADRSAVGCTDSSCLAEIAGAMGANLVVFGDVGKLGSLLILNLNLFDSDKARAIGRVSIQTRSVEELPGKLSPALKKLVQGFAEAKGLAVEKPAPTPEPMASKDADEKKATSGTATATITDDGPAASADSATASAAEASSEGGLPILPIAVMGTGAILGVAGTAVAVIVPILAAGAAGTASNDGAAALEARNKENYDKAQGQYTTAMIGYWGGLVGGALVALVGGGAVGGGAALMFMGGESE